MHRGKGRDQGRKDMWQVPSEARVDERLPWTPSPDPKSRAASLVIKFCRKIRSEKS